MCSTKSIQLGSREESCFSSEVELWKEEIPPFLRVTEYIQLRGKKEICKMKVEKPSKRFQK